MTDLGTSSTGAAAAARSLPRMLAAIAFVLAFAATSVALGADPAHARPSGPQGVDVSHYQGNINWDRMYNDGIRWAYIKATEGTYYTDSAFDSNYPEAYYAGVIRGAYHFARPDGDASAQARFFIQNGGAWSADGMTLPGAVDLEGNPYGGYCYGNSDAANVNWIHEFSNTYQNLTGRYPVIYTSPSWWNTCTGGSNDFVWENPLWVAHWGVSSPDIPNGFEAYTWSFWQYTNSGNVGGESPVDRDVWNGDMSSLRRMACGGPC